MSHPREEEAKFWMEPTITLERNYGLSENEVSEVIRIIEERKDEIAKGWREHFRR